MRPTGTPAPWMERKRPGGSAANPATSKVPIIDRGLETCGNGRHDAEVANIGASKGESRERAKRRKPHRFTARPVRASGQTSAVILHSNSQSASPRALRRAIRRLGGPSAHFFQCPPAGKHERAKMSEGPELIESEASNCFAADRSSADRPLKRTNRRVPS